ncbi:GNAT family N-acetyltransferase [Dysgonomonas sp. Marseille-P4361]|uniref:GNAT family N-acetyltransferase n=1 Tax=Dysgonomonas sp. Marseille-P4361 TaxID=2161820 RepID=UPI000D5534C4|nr:GNAT family N-acetyltransferase [Dysgonomonas sp. Marseille-P4361]
MNIELVKEYSDELLEAINRLMPRLTSNFGQIDEEYLKQLLAEKNSHLFIARAENSLIIGALTLNIFTIPTSKKAYIEDVVVDNSAQGKGVGKALLDAAICYAREEKVVQVELTSNPSRVAANKLYQKLGFEKRETNYYKLQLK